MTENKNEIDIIELLIKMYLYLKKYIWVLIISISLGVAFTFIKFSFQEDSYSSTMVLETKIDNDYMYTLTFKEFQNRFEKNPGELIVKVINSANDLRKNGNIQTLSKRMNLTIDQAKQISSIKANYKYTKGEPISSFVTINVNSTHKEIFVDLADGIINYINNNEYIKEQNKSDSIFIIEVIKKIDLKINELDNFQTKLLQPDRSVKDIFIFNENSLFSENIMLSSLKEKLKKELSEIKQVHLVEDFYIPNLSKKSIKSELIINLAIFSFLGFIIIFFIILNKKSKKN